MVDNSAIPVISYKLCGNYSIRGLMNMPNIPINRNDIPDINRRAAIIMASSCFHGRRHPHFYPPLPEFRDKSYRFLGYLAASIYEHLQSDYLLINADQTSLPHFHKSLDSNCYIVDQEIAHNWIFDNMFNKFGSGPYRIRSLSMVTSNQPITSVMVSYEFSVCDVYNGQQQPQSLGRQIVIEPHDSWAKLIENVVKAQKSARYFNCNAGDKAILKSAEYRNIVDLPHVNKMLAHYIYRNI